MSHFIGELAIVKDRFISLLQLVGLPEPCNLVLQLKQRIAGRLSDGTPWPLRLRTRFILALRWLDLLIFKLHLLLGGSHGVASLLEEAVLARRLLALFRLGVLAAEEPLLHHFELLWLVVEEVVVEIVFLLLKHY